MSDPRSQGYESARKAFDGLNMEERASFLVESVMSMLADGVGEAGRVVQEVVDEMTETLDKRWKECQDEDGPADTKEQAPGSGASKAKKPGSRRSRTTAGKKSSGGKTS